MEPTAPSTLCSIGHLRDTTRGTPYNLTAAPVSDADLATVATVGEVSLPIWAEQCNAVAPDCEATWRATIGAQLGL